MASINPYAEGKKHILFVYDTPMAFQIHFCLTIISKVIRIMAMKVKLILVLLNSLFTIQACIRQETKERKKIYVAEHIKKEVPIPLDTSVNGIILDDTVSLNNIFREKTSRHRC